MKSVPAKLLRVVRTMLLTAKYREMSSSYTFKIFNIKARTHGQDRNPCCTIDTALAVEYRGVTYNLYVPQGEYSGEITSVVQH